MEKEVATNIKMLTNDSISISVGELTTQFNCAIKSCTGACGDNEVIIIEKEDLKAIIKKVAFYVDLE